MRIRAVRRRLSQSLGNLWRNFVHERVRQRVIVFVFLLRFLVRTSGFRASIGKLAWRVAHGWTSMKQLKLGRGGAHALVIHAPQAT